MIFTVTTIRDPGQGVEYRDKKCHGYFLTLDEAKKAVEFGRGYVECLYDWLVIESFEPGTPAIAEDKTYWYHFYDAFGWMEVEKPDFAEGLVNWAIG